MAKTLTAAQYRALLVCVAQVAETEARKAAANAAGRPVSLLTDRTSVVVSCDKRSAGCLVEAGLARWAPGWDGHSEVTLTPDGFTTAHENA